MENQSSVSTSNFQQTVQPAINEQLAPIQQKTNPLPIAITAIMCAILFGLGGFYLGMQSSGAQKIIGNIQTPPISSPSPNSSSSPTTTPTISNPTASWETYADSEYSFKHPKGLKSDTGAAGTGFESIRFQFMGPKQTASKRTQTSLSDGYSFVVTKIGLASQKTPTQWAEERKNNSKENCGPQVILSDVRQIAVDKGSGVQYSIKNCIGDYTSSYVSYNSNVYEITQLYVGEAADQKGYEEITNQIFNTLKFL